MSTSMMIGEAIVKEKEREREKEDETDNYSAILAALLIR